MYSKEKLDLIHSELKQTLEKCLPGIKMNTGYSDSYFRADVSNNNYMLKGSPYFYSGDLKFIHWTSVNNLLSIINSREIRMYNLYNSDDEDEFAFAAEILGLENKVINFLKKYYFTFSFCNSTELNNRHLWENYGKNHKGVALEFSIENEPQYWERFMLADVEYGSSEHFKNFTNGIELLKKKYNVDFTGVNIAKLIGFHKKQNFLNEKEVRLASHFPYEYEEQYIKFAKPEFRIDSNRNRITEYISVPLWVNNNSEYVKNAIAELSRVSQYNDKYFETKPKIKIAKIYFGENCGLKSQEFFSYQKRIHEIFLDNYGYKIETEIFNIDKAPSSPQ